jgi:hypothetical protein
VNCYCQAQGICDGCEGHICAGQCVCERDGAPETQEAVTVGYVNPSQARVEAWQTKQELTR